MDRRRFAAFAVAGLALASPAGALAARAKDAPTTWDNLVRVNSKKLPLVYLAPGADFRVYHKVMLDPTEVAFHKNWARDYNSQTRSLSGKVSDADIQKAVVKGVAAAGDLFAEAFTKAGYPVVAQPAPDVLRVRTAILELMVTAPDVQTMGRTHNFAGEAGSAALMVEVRDSTTGAILGRAVDRRVAGDNSSALRNSVTNRSDFRLLVKNWAKISASGLQELKALSPVSGAGQGPA
jgi:hypothetical protein